MNVTILLYSHSDCSDIWPATINLLRKNASDFEIHFLVNDISNCDDIPTNWHVYIYDEQLVWSERIMSYIQNIDCKYIIYLQEDWLIIDTIFPKIISCCIDFMENHNCQFLMSYADPCIFLRGPNENEKYETGYTNFIFQPVWAHFLQPAIWNISMFKNFLQRKMTINEAESRDALLFTSAYKCYGVKNIFTDKYETTKALLLPHMHAIVTGGYVTKYPTLKTLLEYYGVDTKKRKDSIWWKPNIQ